MRPSRRDSKVYKHVLQAYVSLKPTNWHGVQVDFGKFVTSAGAEVTETHLNWNYSRSLLFANGPYYHFGLRTTAPLSKNFTAGVQLVNGWNNVEDNNAAKTVGLHDRVYQFESSPGRTRITSAMKRPTRWEA